jgi:hypothetical protein
MKVRICQRSKCKKFKFAILYLEFIQLTSKFLISSICLAFDFGFSYRHTLDILGSKHATGAIFHQWYEVNMYMYIQLCFCRLQDISFSVPFQISRSLSVLQSIIMK